MEARGRLLVVDDNVANIEIVVEALEDDYDLRTAECGRNALEILPEFCPDVVLLDIMMPGMDGYEVCRRIRENTALRHTKVILVSAKALTADRLEGYECGADDYITKPFHVDELLSKVRVFCRLKSVEEVDRLKTDLLSLFRHETRTPLNGILLPAELLASGGASAAEQQELATTVLDNAQGLNRLLERVEKLVAAQSGALHLDLNPWSLRTVAQQALAAVESRAAEKDVTIEEQLDTDAKVQIDSHEIAVCLVEILANAVHFSPVGGRVDLSVGVEGSQACLRVVDRGPGIDPDFLPRVFEGFACHDVAHHSDGHGLSLALARQVVLRHGGSVDVESEKGAGATFTLRLPLALTEEASATARSS